ncbi:MAG: toll/interleukin-1 receptor domain-containing protein [Pyrinomonadaceae bacterium]
MAVRRVITSVEDLLKSYNDGALEFATVRLPGAKLGGVNLQGANLRHAILVDAELSASDLRGANLTHATLQGANLRFATLANARLDQSNLRRARLYGANLESASLVRANMRHVDLLGASLAGANLSHASLHTAKLTRANLNDTNLSGAILKFSNVSHASAVRANLEGANLVSASLAYARLSEANLTRAILRNTNLKHAVLTGAIVNDTIVGGTMFLDVNLSGFCRGNVRHVAPSMVDFRSIIQSSREPLLKEFLLRTGMPDVFVEYMVACAYTLNPRLMFSLLQSTFISYGGPDELFARKLNDALQRRGVTTFFFKDDAPVGAKLHRVMRRGVNEHDRVILICSQNSLDRAGVINELEETLAREARDGGAEYLIPIRLDDYVFNGWNPTNADIAQAVRDRVVADFTEHHIPRRFDDELAKLISALKKPKP